MVIVRWAVDRVARPVRLYVLAVAVNMAIAAAPPGTAGATGQTAVVRPMAAGRGRFDPRERAGTGTVLTVPLTEAGAPSGARWSSPN